jgi:LytS/YehU family sensor histidine kinase
MRYLLYESEHGETLISHEISFMINYIDLMKLRLSSRVELQIDFPKEITEFTVPPLLFIPFIENAFKHGISNREHSFISIRMKIDRGKICFIAENSIGSGAHQVDLQYSGIGLENVQKRLGLLFPASHQLKINQDQSTFRVELTIQREKLQV